MKFLPLVGTYTRIDPEAFATQRRDLDTATFMRVYWNMQAESGLDQAMSVALTRFAIEKL
jgi:hypothetical protein